MIARARTAPPWALSALLAALYLLLDPPSADLAAQAYRTELFDRAGFVLWDNAWYGGHHMPGYSVLFPPLAGWTDPRVLAALSAVAATALFAAIARERLGDGWRAGAWWFAVGSAAPLVSGRLTFALGAAIALGAVLLAVRGRPVLAALVAAVACLASPVAGLFLGLAGAAWLLGGTGAGARRGGVLLAAGGMAPALALSVLFPEGGTEPFVASAFWPALVALVLIGVVLPAEQRVLRVGVALYALGVIGSFVLDTPVGGNATRLAALLAGPVLLAVLWPRRTPWLLVAGLGLVYWQWYPPVRDWSRASGDPSVHAAYYAPVLAYLERQPGPLRIESAFTANHWDARWLAPHVALARGWERQLDLRHNALFYEGTLTAARYRAWLRENAIAYVALPDVALDGSAQDEARLLRAGVPGLEPVLSTAHWRLWRVRDATPLATGGRLTAMATDHFTVQLPATGGSALVRIRWSRWWRVDAGDGSVSEGPRGWTTVRGRGVVRVRTEV